MKILITGGGGFQGSHLVEYLLDKGHSVSVISTYSGKSVFNLSQILPKINLIWGSITDNELMTKSIRGHDVVYHLAAHINVDESLLDPLVFLNVNVLGTYNILEAVRKYKCRLILGSTCEVYGDGHSVDKNYVLNEHAELRPNSPYAASKAAADRLTYSYYKSFGVNATIVRPFNVFGERQKSGRFGSLIPILVAKALKGEDLTIFGDGKAARDFSHVSDIVRGYGLILERTDLVGKVVNLGSGENTTVKEIADYVAGKMSVKVVHGPSRPGEVTNFLADVSFAKSLGYNPKVNIWTGIDRYICWVKENQKFLQ